MAPLKGHGKGPLVWNVMYDDFLRMDLPVGTCIVGFADNALVVCTADDVGTLELRINESLWQAKRWLDSRDLKMASGKTEALRVTDKHWWTQESEKEAGGERGPFEAALCSLG